MYKITENVTKIKVIKIFESLGFQKIGEGFFDKNVPNGLKKQRTFLLMANKCNDVVLAEFEDNDNYCTEFIIGGIRDAKEANRVHEIIIDRNYEQCHFENINRDSERVYYRFYREEAISAFKLFFDNNRAEEYPEETVFHSCGLLIPETFLGRSPMFAEYKKIDKTFPPTWVVSTHNLALALSFVKFYNTLNEKGKEIYKCCASQDTIVKVYLQYATAGYKNEVLKMMESTVQLQDNEYKLLTSNC